LSIRKTLSNCFEKSAFFFTSFVFSQGLDDPNMPACGPSALAVALAVALAWLTAGAAELAELAELEKTDELGRPDEPDGGTYAARTLNVRVAGSTRFTTVVRRVKNGVAETAGTSPSTSSPGRRSRIMLSSAHHDLIGPWLSSTAARGAPAASKAPWSTYRRESTPLNGAVTTL